MNNRPFTFEQFKQIYSQVPRLCVELVVLQNGKILLTKRAIEPHKGGWHLPGGTVQITESIDEAVSRVADEELGLKISDHKFLDYIDFGDTNHSFDHAVSLVFVCQPEAGVVKINDDASAADYFNRAPDGLIPVHEEFLQRHDLL